MFRMIWQRLQPTLLPRVCLVCRGSIEDNKLSSKLICRGCERDFERNLMACSCCAEPINVGNVESGILLCVRCQKKRPAFQQVLAPYLYRYPLSELIQRFKSKDNLLLSRLMADLLADYLAVKLNSSADTPIPNLIVPVPTHWRTRLKRGFNPAACLADAVGQRLNIPVDMSLLSKQRYTASQHDLNRAQRLKNLRQSFGLRDSERIKGLSVALVDDVVTTASTADVIAALLRDNGADSVQVWAIARTPYSQR